MNCISLIAAYLIFINLISVIFTVYDKLSAIKHRSRVKESTLILLSALGGSIGMYITMQLIRHKTKHIKFMIGIPAIFIMQIAVIFILWRIL